MSARQLYRQPRTPEQIVNELTELRAKQWDPDVVDVVLRLIDTGELELGSDGLRLLERAPEVPTRAGLAVLLVEDDDADARLVTEALERALDAPVVARATSIAHAAELVNGSAWSLAIVDHDLPDGPGVDVVDALRQDNPSMPIVMLTGLGAEDTAIEAFRRGASDYVVKGSAYPEALAIRIRGLVTA
jgi:CheY-like chemotaxis protein